jgi:hypothetical protein
MKFREKKLDDLKEMAETKIKNAETSLKKIKDRVTELKRIGADTSHLEARAKEIEKELERRGIANKAASEPILKEWYEAPGQKVVVEIELEPGALDDILNSAVDENFISQYQNKDVFIWKFERGYGRNIGIPPWQLDRFNKSVKAIRFYAERGTSTFSPRKIPSGVN